MFKFLHHIYVAATCYASSRIRSIDVPALADPFADSLEEDMPGEMLRRSRSGGRAVSMTEREFRLFRCLKGKEELAAAASELNAANDEIKALTTALDAFKTEVASLKKAHMGLAGDLSKAEGNNRKLVEHTRAQSLQLADYAAMRTRLAETTRELDVYRRQKQEMEALLQVRSAELRDAQEYLGKSDTVSHADVQRMVENLNSQIFQTAASVADEFSFETTRSYFPRDDFVTTCRSVAQSVGYRLTEAVAHNSHGEDSFLVQVMVQAYFAAQASHVVYFWDIGLSPARNALLSEIHNRIFRAGKQSALHEWRARLTSIS